MSENTEVHSMQTFLDNQWLMLAIAVLTPTVIYTLWGLWDVINIPLAP